MQIERGAEVGNIREEKILLDSFDLKILDVLQKQGRISNAKLALEIGLSESASFSRVRRLEQRQVIAGYRVQIDQPKVATFITVHAHVVLESHKHMSYSKFTLIVDKIPEVIRCDQVTGQYDYILTVVARDMNDYSRVMEHIMEMHGQMSHYFSHIVMRAIKDRPVPASYIADPPVR